MWYFTRNSDGKEFRMVSLFMGMVNGLAEDGEKTSLFNEEYSDLYEKGEDDGIKQNI